jgi:Ca2+/Na+ antiporter
MEEEKRRMTKRYANMALVYGLAAMVCGVFYREYTKFSHFTGVTNLSVMHTHYFLLGMVFFFLLMLAEKALEFSNRNTGKILLVYHIGLNITGLGFLMRGLNQVWETELSSGMDASISGISGIGHILTGVCLVLVLLQVRKRAEG